ncbi:MAG: DNA-binding response regulator [Betaproteobacteria bacterium HGW-Betaproteobacteria-10]|nr:MAG: DNA-binding response regulator [Betaproteobacteria bacterium HGW-Betaproteobacteria-10]
MLTEYLIGEGMGVFAVHDGEAGCREADINHFDLLILDVMLPGISGIEVLRHIRRQGNLPILMLTARGDDVDRIIGLELGADDYLPKPCNPRELSARIRAVLRRTGGQYEARLAETAPNQILTLSSAKRVARWHGETLPLTSTEFSILEALYEHAGQIVPKAELASRILGRVPARYDRSLDMHVSNLRRKLGKFDDGSSPIQTIHGVGYQLRQS